MILVLDTTVLIDHLRGRPVAGRIEAMAQGGDVLATTGINVEEVIRGLRPSERKAARALIEGLVILPIGRDEGILAGTWRREFAGRGVTLSQADCLVATAAVTSGARLATGNPRDFPMKGLDVEHWPVGG
ncbi:MAG TPA: PIN domain-containing protein [Actinomycetota bacterium]|nr:PIN domain-containing protein [Actinomycetota bacterium]